VRTDKTTGEGAAFYVYSQDGRVVARIGSQAPGITRALAAGTYEVITAGGRFAGSRTTVNVGAGAVTEAVLESTPAVEHQVTIRLPKNRSGTDQLGLEIRARDRLVFVKYGLECKHDEVSEVVHAPRERCRVEAQFGERKKRIDIDPGSGNRPTVIDFR
jgi:hypothetical protein